MSQKEKVIQALYNTDLESAALVWAAKKLSESQDSEEPTSVIDTILSEIDHNQSSFNEAINLSPKDMAVALKKVHILFLEYETKSESFEALLKSNNASMIKALLVLGISNFIDTFIEGK